LSCWTCKIGNLDHIRRPLIGSSFQSRHLNAGNSTATGVSEVGRVGGSGFLFGAMKTDTLHVQDTHNSIALHEKVTQVSITFHEKDIQNSTTTSLHHTNLIRQLNNRTELLMVCIGDATHSCFSIWSDLKSIPSFNHSCRWAGTVPVALETSSNLTR
jgi:hypothetical protein